MASVTWYKTSIKRIREQRVSTYLLIYSFLFFKLMLEFGLNFEFKLGLTLLVRVKARVKVWRWG